MKRVYFVSSLFAAGDAVPFVTTMGDSLAEWLPVQGRRLTPAEPMR